jgi:hypothetical protein
MNFLSIVKKSKLLFSSKAIFFISDIQSETGKFCRIFLDAIDFPFRTELCARRASVIYPDILTLPGTVGRGFYALSVGKCEMAHGYLCYAQISANRN